MCKTFVSSDERKDIRYWSIYLTRTMRWLYSKSSLTQCEILFLPFFSPLVFWGIHSKFHKRIVFILFTVTMGLPLRFSFSGDISFSFTEVHTNISDSRYSRRRYTNFLINNRIISIMPANLCIHWLLGNVGILFRITKFVNNRTHLRDSHIGTRNLDN